MGLFNTRKTIIAGFILSVLMIFFFAFYANRDLKKVRKESAEAENIILSLSTIEAILDDMQDIETSQRGYLLSGDESYLSVYRDGLDRLKNDTGRLKKVAFLFPSRTAKIEELLFFVRQKLQFVAHTIDLRKASGLDASLLLVKTSEGKILMDSIRRKISRMEESDRAALAAENRERREASSSTSRLFNIMAIAFFVFLSLLFWYAYSNLKAVERYEKENSYLASLIEHTSDAIVSLDERGHIQSWNRAAEKIYGYTAGEVIGRFAPSVTRSGLTKESIETLREKVLREGMVNQEVLQYASDGREIYTLASITPVKDAKGRFRGFVSVLKDITERKMLEEQLRLFNRELSRQVDEKTGRLIRVNEQLTSTNRDLEQFAYIASHDLQEPLRAIKSFLNLLEQKYGGQLDETAKLYIRQSIDGSNRMKELITELLNFSRVGRRHLKMEAVDMNRLTAGVAASLQPAIHEAGAVLNLPPLPTVKGDSTQLGLLLQNLIGNSIKYRRAGTPPVIELGVTEEKGRYIFHVRDNGIGFERKHWDSIFNVFYRLHTPAEYPGTGIGLAICKKIVELHEGRIWVESEPGVGTVFHFTLPI
jgi:PAS domain S-box-containing protein